MSYEEVDLEKATVFGSQLPNGIYEVKLADLEVGQTKEGDPMVKPLFEVIAGPERGLMHQSMYFLGTYTDKQGHTQSAGINNIKRDAIELGVLDKLPKSFPTDPNKVRVILYKAFGGKKMRIHIKDGEPSKKDGKVYKETRILRPETTSYQTTQNEEIEVI